MAAEEAVHARAAAEVQHGLAGPQRGEVEEVADAGERVDRRSRDPVQVGGLVAQALGQRPPGLEVDLAVGLERDLLVHALHALFELDRVQLTNLGGHLTVPPFRW